MFLIVTIKKLNLLKKEQGEENNYLYNATENINNFFGQQKAISVTIYLKYTSSNCFESVTNCLVVLDVLRPPAK